MISKYYKYDHINKNNKEHYLPNFRTLLLILLAQKFKSPKKNHFLIALNRSLRFSNNITVVIKCEIITIYHICTQRKQYIQMSCFFRGHNLNNGNHSCPICCHNDSLHTKILSFLYTHQYLQKEKMAFKTPFITLLLTNVMSTNIKLNSTTHLGNKIMTKHM
jgi:hypothetical protein